MNRLEKILEAETAQLARFPDDRLWVDTYGKRVAFFKWLLDDGELPTYEVHQPKVKPTVWGMGDVSHHIHVQLRGIKTPAEPVVLVFDYQSSASKAKGGK